MAKVLGLFVRYDTITQRIPQLWRPQVWVRFPKLPVECFNKLALFEIAKLDGTPSKVDFATDSVSRARYARVCVEISVGKPLVASIWVVNGWQRIEYENLDLLCLTCGIVGHLEDKCPQLQQTIHAKSTISGKVLPNSSTPHRLPSISGMIDGEPRNQLTEQHGDVIPLDNTRTMDHSPKPNE
ncbi:hypothetical protein Cgig2_005086 [Carnegiea gigantea]|uniref:CCHC-type domain-containing protein n=1 Tax=Carnegiea gigantea TaxID=171969 RepID=A0A9Q1KZF6_9CARY|nr:hypothetical protein Cgig2_005086 [Carnegiea gigantea]